MTFNETHTFTRPISATFVDINGVTQTAGVNVPRFEFAMGEPLGLKFGAQDKAICPLADTWYNPQQGTYFIRAQAPIGMTILMSGQTVLQGVGSFKTYVVRWQNGENLLNSTITLFPNADTTNEPTYVAKHTYQPKYLTDVVIDDMMQFNSVTNGEWS